MAIYNGQVLECKLSELCVVLPLSPSFDTPPHPVWPQSPRKRRNSLTLKLRNGAIHMTVRRKRRAVRLSAGDRLNDGEWQTVRKARHGNSFVIYDSFSLVIYDFRMTGLHCCGISLSFDKEYRCLLTCGNDLWRNLRLSQTWP